MHEELGLKVQPGRLLVADYVPPREGRTDGVMFVYDGGVLASAESDGIRLPVDELSSWAWSTVEEAEQRLSPLLARRAPAAVRAADTGTTLYLENGAAVV